MLLIATDLNNSSFYFLYKKINLIVFRDKNINYKIFSVNIIVFFGEGVIYGDYCEKLHGFIIKESEIFYTDKERKVYLTVPIYRNNTIYNRYVLYPESRTLSIDKIDKKNLFFNLLTKQIYAYSNKNQNQEEFVKDEILIKKISYIATLFIIRKNGYFSHEKEYYKVIIIMPSRYNYSTIKSVLELIIDNYKVYDSATYFFLFNTVRNIIYDLYTDIYMYNLVYIRKYVLDLDLNNDIKKVLELGDIKLYFYEASDQKYIYSEEFLCKIVTNKINENLFNYNIMSSSHIIKKEETESDLEIFLEKMFIASLSKFSDLKLIDTIYIDKRDCNPCYFRMWNYVVFSSNLLEYQQQEFQIYYNKLIWKTIVNKSRNISYTKFKYLKIDIYESKIKYGDKNLNYVFPIFNLLNNIKSNINCIKCEYEINEYNEEVCNLNVYSRNIFYSKNASFNLSIDVVSYKKAEFIVNTRYDIDLRNEEIEKDDGIYLVDYLSY